jgi:hypothetical protein
MSRWDTEFSTAPRRSRKNVATFLIRFMKPHHRVYKGPSLVLIPCQMNPIHTIVSYSFYIHFNIIFQLTCVSRVITFIQGYQINIFLRISNLHMHVTCPVHPNSIR